jgi:hypothetical protein
VNGLHNTVCANDPVSIVGKDAERPTITINGDNAANITVGAIYADPTSVRPSPARPQISTWGIISI